MIYRWSGQYQIFTDYFFIGFRNWDKGTGSLGLLLWWDLSIGWLRIRKYKTDKEIAEAVRLLKERNK